MIKEKLDMDSAMEHDICSLGLTYPRVEKAQVDAYMAKVEYDVHVIEGTTTTVVTAILPMRHIRWTLATETMACVDPRNYDAEFGRKHGIEKCEKSARDELWKGLGFALALELSANYAHDNCA